MKLTETVTPYTGRQVDWIIEKEGQLHCVSAISAYEAAKLLGMTLGQVDDIQQVDDIRHEELEDPR